MRRTRHKGQCGHQTHCFQHTFHFLSIRGDRPLCRRSLPIRCKESANSYLPSLKVHLSSFPLQRYNNFPTKQISNGKYMQNKRYSSPHRYNAAIFRTRCNREIEPDRTGCGRIFSLRRIIYFYPKYPLIYFNGRSEDDSVHRGRNSTNFGERHSVAEWGLPCRHRTACRTAAPKHRRNRIAEKHSDKMPCSTTTVRTATVRQNEASHPQQKSGPAFSPKEGGAARIPAIRPERKGCFQTKNRSLPVQRGSGLPDDLQAAPPIRLSGRNLTEIRRQRLRYISS